MEREADRAAAAAHTAALKSALAAEYVNLHKKAAHLREMVAEIDRLTQWARSKYPLFLPGLARIRGDLMQLARAVAAEVATEGANNED